MVNDFTISPELDLKIGNKSSIFLYILKEKIDIKTMRKYFIKQKV